MNLSEKYLKETKQLKMELGRIHDAMTRSCCGHCIKTCWKSLKRVYVFRVLGDQSWNGRRRYGALWKYVVKGKLYCTIKKERKQIAKPCLNPFCDQGCHRQLCTFCTMVEILVNKIKLFVWAGGAAIKKIRRAAREFQMQTKVCLPSLEMHSMFWCPLILIIIFWFPSYL